MAKGKKFKKVLVFFTLVQALVGVSYVAIEPVRETVNDGIKYVIDKGEELINSDKFNFNKTKKLEDVRNVVFDEKNRMLTFDKNPKTNNYRVDVNYNENQYAETFKGNSIEISLMGKILDGDKITFKIVALGDYIETRNSDGIIYEHTFEFQNEAIYNGSKYELDGILRKSAGLSKNLSLRTLQASAFNLVGENLVIVGTGKSAAGKDINFTAEINFSAYEEKDNMDLYNPNDFEGLMNFIYNRMTSKNSKIFAEYSEHYINMYDVLEKNGAFDEYLEDGYKIEVLYFTNSGIGINNDKSFVDFTAVYRAVHETKPNITFKQSDRILVEGEHLEMNDFLEEALQGAEISEVSNEVYDFIMNDHLEKTLEADASQSRVAIEEREREK